MLRLPRYVRVTAWLGALIALAWPGMAAGQVTTPGAPTPEQVVRSALRSAMIAQEAYFADHKTYSTSARMLRSHSGTAALANVAVLAATSRGYGMVAMTPGVPGLVCGVFVGTGPQPFGGGEEGTVECRGP